MANNYPWCLVVEKSKSSQKLKFQLGTNNRATPSRERNISRSSHGCSLSLSTLLSNGSVYANTNTTHGIIFVHHSVGFDAMRSAQIETL